MGTTLAIETAGIGCSAALVADGVVIDERYEAVGRGHAERLIPMIADLIGDRRPQRIAVDCGPGSFTGVRVGLAAARGLGLGWQIPVTGFSSTALIAASAFQQSDADSVAIAIAGGHGQLFVECFRRSAFASLGPLQSLYPEDAARACNSMPLLAGSGAEVLAAAGLATTPRVAVEPRASAIRWLNETEYLLPPVPIYGRPPDARPQQSGEA